MSTITMGLMTVEDVDAVHAIETACFKTPWSKKSFYDEVTQNACARYMVVREDGEAIAYAGV
ncbi:MAG: ribosomal-protein-alanine N-acetyltransferase RimI, partial [Clostridia bacterium]|nr:ribosomal-protein-alanine N-acetyltransferase RimI [Clostridia bacterium]